MYVFQLAHQMSERVLVSRRQHVAQFQNGLELGLLMRDGRRELQELRLQTVQQRRLDRAQKLLHQTAHVEHRAALGNARVAVERVLKRTTRKHH